MYRIITLYIVLLNVFLVKAGDTLNTGYIDVTTYQYYLNKNWDQLIELGTKANKADIDFYYLQLRMGTAYFYKKNYRKAAYYFEKAFKLNPLYEYTQEMLYYSYLYSGEIMKLKPLSKSMSATLLSKITKDKNSGLNSLFIQSAFIPELNETSTKGSGRGRNSSSDINADPEDKLIYGNQQYYCLGSSFFIHKNINLTLAYSFLSLDKYKETKINDVLFNPDLKTTQNQLYLKSDARIAKNLTLTGALHYLKYSTNIGVIYPYEYTYEVTDNYEYDTLIEGVDVHVDVYDTLNGIYDTGMDSYTSPVSDNDYSFYFGMKYRFNYFNVSLGAAYSRFSLSKHIQGNIETTIFPFGNLNTYTNTNITYVVHKTSQYNTFSRSNTIISQDFGQKLTPYLWLELNYTKGNMKDATFYNNFLVYNSIFNINEKIGATLIVPLKYFTFTLNYQYLKKEDNVINYQIEQDVNYTADGKIVYVSSWYEDTGTGGMGSGAGTQQLVTQTDEYTYNIILTKDQITYSQNSYKFNHHLISGGILWKF